MESLHSISPNAIRNKRLPAEFTELYTELFQLAEKLKGPISYFTPFEGLWYRDSCIKFMLVGRCENVWTLFKEKTLKSFLSNVNFINKNGMNWLDPFGVSRKTFINYKTGLDYRRDINNELFWINGKLVFDSLLNGRAAWPPWFENIVWTNLFPLASCDRDTVTEFQKSFQLETARKLLLAQINFFSPTHIVFLTGWEKWFEHFCDCFSDVLKVENSTNILARGRYKNSKIAVLEHEKAICKEEQLNKLFLQD